MVLAVPVAPGSAQSDPAAACEKAQLALMADSAQRRASDIAEHDSALDRRRAATKVLLSSADPEQRAAGLLLAVKQPYSESDCTGIDCNPQTERHAAETTRFGSQLAEMARDTRSPTVYAWALFACGSLAVSGQPPASCSQLNVVRWTELAPTSAWSWLALAGDARRRADLSGVETAIHRLSLATDWVNPAVPLQRRFAASLGGMAADPEQQQALMSAMGLVTSMTSDMQHLSAYCRPGMDANRTQLCTRIAEQFIAQSDSLLQLSMAIQVGERAGLGEVQLSAARKLREAGLLQFASINSLAPDNPGERPQAADSRRSSFEGDASTVPAALIHVACRNRSPQLAFAQRIAEIGELNAVREVLTPRARQ